MATGAGLELYMTELHLRDWAAGVRWYTTVLGLPLVWSDPARGFALVDAGAGRLALKQDDRGNAGVRLVFRVDDVDAARERLAGLGEDVSPAADHPREPFREARLHDLEGTPVTLFAWTGARQGPDGGAAHASQEGGPDRE